MSNEENNSPKHSKIFKSPSTGQLCTPSQYAAEIVCLRYAEKENIGNLAYKFWNKKQKKAYQSQVICACKLVEEFGEEKLIGYLLDNPKIYSLGYYKPHQFIKDGLSRYKPKNKPAPSGEIEEKKEINIRKQAPKKINLLEQLNRIDNGKN
jgi:hypothetical protein